MSESQDPASGQHEPALQVDWLPTLHEPVLLAAFSGWNDAAQSATGSVRYLIEKMGAVRFAGIDPEEFYVFSETRPTVRLVNGTQRQLEWPSNDFHYLRGPEQGNDLVLLAGIEPQLQWNAFTRTILDLVRQLNIRGVIVLGGLLADVPHTASVKLTGGASHPERLPRWIDLGLRTSRYEGPTGIVGVLSDACRRGDIPSASVWANVPHYINVSPNPKTMAALIHHVNRLFDLHLDLQDLDAASARFEGQVAEAIRDNPEVRRYVEQLEESVHEEEAADPASELPTGQAIVEELEEFLRQRHREDADEDDEEDDDD